MNLEIAQLNYLKRMKKRKERSNALLGEMRAIAFNKSREEKPTVRRVGRSNKSKFKGFYVFTTPKGGFKQLNFERV